MTMLTRRRFALGAAGIAAAAALPTLARADGFDIAAEIALLGTAGGEVVVPPGNHSLPSALTVPANVTLRGSGMGATRLTIDGDHHGILLDGDNARLLDFTLDGLGGAKTVAGWHGIRIDGGSANQAIERVRLVAIPGHGITEATDGGQGITIRDCRLEQIGYASGYVTGYAALAIRALSGIIAGNTIRGASKWGIELYPQSALVASSLTVEGNHVDGVSAPGSAMGTGIEVSAKRQGDRVIGNGVYNCAQIAIHMNACQYATVSANVLGGSPYALREAAGNHNRCYGNAIVSGTVLVNGIGSGVV